MEGTVAQSAEASDLKSVQYGFESHLSYQTIMSYQSNKTNLPPTFSDREYESKIAALEEKIAWLEETVRALVAQLDRATDF